MTKAVQKIMLSPSRDIPFNKLVLSRRTFAMVKLNASSSPFHASRRKALAVRIATSFFFLVSTEVHWPLRAPVV